MRRAHKPAKKRSETRKFGDRCRKRFRIKLVPDQDRFVHYRADATRFREPCQCDEQMN